LADVFPVTERVMISINFVFCFESSTKDSNKEMQIGELLGNELLTVESGEDLAKAAKLMSLYKVSGILTVDKEGNLEGVISSSDISRAYSEIETHSRLIKKDPHFV